MSSFVFQTTPSILSEVGSTARMGEIMAKKGCRTVFFVTDKGILDLALAETALAGFREAGVETVVFSDVEADPPEAMILSAVEKARAAGCDGVASVGGGSSLDTAKLIAVLLAGEQAIAEIYGVGQVTGERLPLVLAPTTAGTGSEVTPIAIVTTGEAEKKGVVSPQLLPDWAILDAELTIGLPAHVTAATGIDAMVHAIEAYTSAHKKNPVSDCLAREALALLGGNIRTACKEPEDRKARGDMLLGSMLAGMAFANAPVAAVHALAYPLGGHFHVPHGLSNALVLPHVLEFNMPEAEAHYAALAPIVFPELAGRSPTEAAKGLVEGFRALGPDLGMKTQLRDVGVSHNNLPKLAEDAMKQERLLINNPRTMTYEAALAIYEKAL
ncbi:probable iron-containing alcohol dehydrogenase [Fulvimarina pelagi HTCC2506]|uniref:Alcohol dehydrogenase 2 n=2 Tax=Fulvimarina pelagi TaxID=217511 RepID=Q0G1Q4_9HYPH|nr:iron-containing alcohol dehydrogenase [Fulvimarina pelagi]EAU41027.1 probable iron-containing alcohol dehydrogenase [Fulvimarina pelagi HTCC2506]BAT30954.1 probable iron-containing alcohol dehydrogenase [Fulvimarina pelagi]